MTQKVRQVAQNGPPQELISHITHPCNLLKNLPSSLPSNTAESWYCFGLNPEDVAEEGIWYAFNRNLEVVLPWLGLGIFNKMDITQGGLL